MNLLARLTADARARALLTPEFVARVNDEFDADDDDRVSFEELLEADLLAMVRRLAATQSVPGGGRSGGRRPGPGRAFSSGSRGGCRQDLALGSGDETKPPAAPVSVVGFPRAVLDLASLHEAHASLTLLLDLIHGLDPDPAAGQMTSSDPAIEPPTQGEPRRFGGGHVPPVDVPGTWVRCGRRSSTCEGGRTGIRIRRTGYRGNAASRIVARVDATLAAIHD